MFKELTYGMVGGDLKALIGECHRKAGMRLLFRNR